MTSLKSFLPKEHGAWAMLILPYTVGVAVGGGLTGRTLVGFLGMLLLFLSRQPLFMSLKGRRSGRDSLRVIKKRFGPSVILMAGGGMLLYLWLSVRHGLFGLLVLGFIAAIIFSFHTFLALNRKERTSQAEILGVSLLTLSAPAGFIISRGGIAKEAFVLWILHALYFSGSVFYVKMRKKAVLLRREMRFPKNINLAKECLAYVLMLILILSILFFAGYVPVMILLAFVPMVAHTLWGIFVLRPKFEIMKQGIILTALSILNAIFMVTFWE